MDKETKTFHYTPEYYVFKHVSHYVQRGAEVLGLHTNFADALGFRNPDGRIVLVLANKDDAPKTVGVSVLVKKALPYIPGVKPFTLPARSINTIVL